MNEKADALCESFSMGARNKFVLDNYLAFGDGPVRDG